MTMTLGMYDFHGTSEKQAEIIEAERTRGRVYGRDGATADQDLKREREIAKRNVGKSKVYNIIPQQLNDG